VLLAFSQRYPTLPLVVSESGIATDVGTRRAESIVRTLESIDAARTAGVDVRGYYHWSLTDNFEWAEGFVPRFGLYRVDYASYSRTASEGADVLGAIAKARTVTSEQRAQYGGIGPMTPDTVTTDRFCAKVP
jgi:beta-glucosidase